MVYSPGVSTAMPSATVPAVGAATGSPLKSAAAAEKRFACTPTTRTLGRCALAATATPLTSPPPPTGTTSVSRSGACSSISSPSVPWPAITASSSKGWTRVQPRSAASCCVNASVSANRLPCSTTSAPKTFVCATFVLGVLRGITMQTGMPSLEPW